jgi:DNA polymerase-3 subunit gamma/tau
MSDSQVIARRFRPQSFDQVVGQEAITKTLVNAITSSRIHHAYLFAGARGVGKTTTARILAKALNCIKGITAEPCGVCDSCREIAVSNSLDVLEIDAASHTGIDNVRDVIIATVQISPARDRFKIFIIDEVHQLSAQAFNALLKTLEEPPSHVKFIMATTELHKVPDTILSRCQIFEFRTISLKKILDQLRYVADKLAINVPDSALLAIARAGEGSMRDAQSALDQVVSFAGREVSDEDVSAALGLVDLATLNETVDAIAAEDANRTLKIIDEIVSRGYDLRNFCRELMVHIRALLVIKIVGFDRELIMMPETERESLTRLAEQFSEQDLLRFFSILTKTEQDIKMSSQPRFQLEMGLMKMVQARRLYLIEDALARLEAIGSSLRLSGSSPAPGQREATESRAGSPEQRSSAHAAARSSSGAVRQAQQADQTPRSSREESRANDPAGRREAGPPPEPPPLDSEPYELEPATKKQPMPGEVSTADADFGERLKTNLERSGKRSLLSFLEHAMTIELSGDTVVITYSPENDYFRKELDKADKRKTLEDAAIEVLGRPAKVRVKAGGKANPSPPVEQKSGRREQVAGDPTVRALVDKFDGKVVEVVEPET